MNTQQPPQGSTENVTISTASSTADKSESSFLHDALRLWALLLRHTRLILIVTLVGAASSAIGSVVFLKNWYAASVNALPPRRAGSVLDNLSGSISSTLKDFGLTKLTGGKTDGYTHHVILQSRRMQDTLITLFNLAKLYNIPDTNWIDLRKELGEHLAIGVEDDGNYVITAWHTDPHEAARMANKTVELGNFFANEIFQAEARTSLRLLEQRYAVDSQNLVGSRDSLMKFSRRYKLFAPIEQARGAATALAELRVQRYKQEIAATMAETAYGSQDPYTQAMRKQLQAVSEQQERAESQPGLAGEFSITNVGSDIALEYTRLFADVEVHTRMKAYIAPLLEQARQDIHRATPALYVLDPAIAPNKKDRPKRSLIVAGTAFGSFILALLYVILRDRFLSLRAQYRAIVAEEAEKNKRT